MARIVKLILTDRRAGTGKADDPIRIVPQLWTKAGVLVAEVDPFTATGFFHAEEVPNA